MPVHPDSSFPPGAGQERLLIDGFRKIELRYVAAPASPERPAPLPRSISIVFTDESASERRITVLPRLNSDGRCRFDPISMSCR
jgi:hypothetical protein